MLKNVVLYKKIPDLQKSKLEKHFNLVCFDGINESNRCEFIEALKESHGAIGTGVIFNSELLDFAPNLQAISTISAGYDNFNLDDLNNRKIRLMNTPDVLTDTTADLIFALVLVTARRIVELSNMVQIGSWVKNIREEDFGVDVHHKTIGILGMGRIGEAVAKRAFYGFDMKVIYYSNHPKIDVEHKYQAEYCDLDYLLQHADFVCITLPLSDSTKKLISKEKLALMKKNAILINGSRGGIIDENALIEVLKKGDILAAGLDVFSKEPLSKNSPLIGLSNAVLLPHIGSATNETRTAMIECAIDNLIAALKIEPPRKNWVNPGVG